MYQQATEAPRILLPVRRPISCSRHPWWCSPPLLRSLLTRQQIVEGKLHRVDQLAEPGTEQLLDLFLRAIRGNRHFVASVAASQRDQNPFEEVRQDSETDQRKNPALLDQAMQFAGSIATIADE